MRILYVFFVCVVCALGVKAAPSTLDSTQSTSATSTTSTTSNTSQDTTLQSPFSQSPAFDDPASKSPISQGLGERGIVGQGIGGQGFAEQGFESALGSPTKEEQLASEYSSQNLQDEVESLLKESKHQVNLAELLEAAKSNDSLQAQLLQVESNRQIARVAKIGFIPKLDVDYSLQHSYSDLRSLDANAMKFGQFGNYRTQNFNARFSLDLFSGFSTINLIRERAATYRSSVANAEYAKQSIYLQVIQEYYSYFNNLSQLLSLKRKYEEVRSDETRVKRLYDAGLSTIDDLESLRSQLSLTEYQIADMKLSVEQNLFMLRYLTKLEFDGLVRQDISTPRLSSDEQRQDIVALSEQTKALEFQKRQYHFYPTVTVADTYTYRIEKPDYVTKADPQWGSFMARQFPTHANTVTLTATFTLFDKITTGFQRQSYQLNKLSKQKELAYKQAEKQKDEALYRKRLEIAKSQIRSSEASLKSANISFENVRKRYNSQLVNFTDYLRSLSTKYDAESTYNQALNNYELQKANYIFYSGQQIQEYVK